MLGSESKHSLSFFDLVIFVRWGALMTRSEIREYVEAFVVAVLLALFIITFIAQSFRVEGSSMEPTLHDGQRLIVDKLSYRFSTPKVGDVVVFATLLMSTVCSLRVIGIPGDEILIEDGIVCRNGRALVENILTARPMERLPQLWPVVIPRQLLRR